MLGAEIGMTITDENIARKMDMPWELFEAYVKGETPSPENIFEQFKATWPELLKNLMRVSHTVQVHLEDEDEE